MAKKQTSRNAEIKRMLQAGCSYQEVADRYGISKGRVAQIVKDNRMKVQTALVRQENNTNALVEQDLNIKNQLVQTNAYYLDLIGVFTAAVNGDKEALGRLDALGVSNKVDTLLKAMRDHSSQLETYTKIAKAALDMEQMLAFQQRVIEAIKANCDEETTRSIIAYLRQDAALERAVSNG